MIVIVWAYIYSVELLTNLREDLFTITEKAPTGGYDLCAGIQISSLLTVIRGSRGLLRDYEIFTKFVCSSSM